MPVDLTGLNSANRLLMTIPLQPLQGNRFQPTGFPSLGAASYQTPNGTCLLVESAQSMANRLELTCWDSASNQPVAEINGISHVIVKRRKNGTETFLTDSMLEAHRINSPYLLEGSDRTFIELLKTRLGELEEGPIDRKKLAEALLRYDVGSLLHGAFLAKKELAGGRLRVARALSAFIEAKGAAVAASGGVKNDHVNPQGDTQKGFGNVPFARDEYVSERIDLFVNLDLAQIRGYGLDEKVQKMLILLALFKIRRLLDGDLRLRTACDLKPLAAEKWEIKPEGFALPDKETIEQDLGNSIQECEGLMEVTTVAFNDELKKGKEKTETTSESEADDSVTDQPDEDQ